MARCSIRRPPTSPRAACRSWRRSACRRARPVMARALAFLRREQEADGSWFGRWGTNYIYGTWSVLCALNAAGVPADDPAVRARGGLAGVGAARRRRLGRGRGKLRRRPARPLQGKHAEPDRLGGARADGGRRGGSSGGGARRSRTWRGPSAPTASGPNCPTPRSGFPRVFYLRYHGYRLYFPLLALARYRNLQRGNDRNVRFGF